jgi:hypothetical protein
VHKPSGGIPVTSLHPDTQYFDRLINPALPNKQVGQQLGVVSVAGIDLGA